MGYYPYLLNYQEFGNLNPILKEFYCISGASLGILKVQL
jgi:hypothetical protein